MYRKIVVPLDGSEEGERVLPIVKDVLAPGGEVVLLHIITPSRFHGAGLGDFPVHGEKIEEAGRQSSLNYLESVRQGVGKVGDRWRCEVVITGSVADGITDLARREDADLIAMYTHDRKGLAGLILGSVAEKVRRRAPIEVQIFRPWEFEP